MQHIISIEGQNSRPPVFSQDSYEATISKVLPPDVPFHFVDETFDITAEDHDFVAPNDVDSNNTVAVCTVEEDSDGAIQCGLEKMEGSEAYRVLLSLKKHIDNFIGLSYSFKLKTQVKSII